MKKLKKPRVERVEDTEVGKLLAESPEERKRHDQIVAELREAARPELEALWRSERITFHDLHQMVY